MDQESTQRMVLSRFFGVTPKEPWLHLDDHRERIYVVWDPPHLIKCVRNNLKKHDLVVNNAIAQLFYCTLLIAILQTF
jgi:hypothetical protein